MATTVLFNGVIYSIPLYGDVGYAQGAGNLSAYLIALAGGPFPFTSQSANPATAGTIRLAHSDTIDWRNQANSGNLPLGVNASDQLTFNGTPLAVNGGGTVNSGTAGHGAYYATTGTAVSDAGAVATQFGSAILTATTNQLILGTTRTTTISADQPAFASRSIVIPDPGGPSKFILQDIQGSAQQQISTPLILNGSITFNPTTLGIVGTTTNNDAVSGNIGEYISNTATVNMVTTGYTTITSIALTAGDWDISFVAYGNGAAGATALAVGIATATNSATGHVTGDNAVSCPVTTIDNSCGVAVWRTSLNGSQTYYLTGKSFGATISTAGRISARRVR